MFSNTFSTTQEQLKMVEQYRPAITARLLQIEDGFHSQGIPHQFARVRAFDRVGQELSPPVTGEALAAWITGSGIQYAPPQNGKTVPKNTPSAWIPGQNSFTGNLVTHLEGIGVGETRAIPYENESKARRGQTEMSAISNKLGWRHGKKSGYTTTVEKTEVGAVLNVTRTQATRLNGK